MPDLDDMRRQPLVLRPPEIDIKVRRDLPYRDAMLADIYLPPHVARPPIVIFIHGGPIPKGLQPKNSRLFSDYGRLLASSGFAAVTFNHRFFDDPADVEALIDFVRSQTDLDVEQIFLWAFSGGGPFLSIALGRSYVRGIVGYYAALDLIAQPGSKIVTSELRARFSPLGRLKAGEMPPPVFLARAGKDFEPLNAVLQQFVDEALQQNIEIELMNHPAGEHGFDILNDDERSRSILRRTIEFMREHLR